MKNIVAPLLVAVGFGVASVAGTASELPDMMEKPGVFPSARSR